MAPPRHLPLFLAKNGMTISFSRGISSVCFDTRHFGGDGEPPSKTPLEDALEDSLEDALEDAEVLPPIGPCPHVDIERRWRWRRDVR
jgi:hypothetical protein